LKHKHRNVSNPPAEDATGAENPVDLAELIQTAEDLETAQIVAAAVEKAVEITDDDVLAIRRLRNSLIERLFTPDRRHDSWTNLKATN
jgi:hypothetical protein